MGIPYADGTNNVVVGCNPVSPGCANCWSKALHDQRHAAYLDGKHLPEQYAHPFSEVHCHPERLVEPLHWKRPRVIFTCSGADLFHPDVSNEFRASVFGVMAACPQHTFLVLTKRALEMAAWFEWADEEASGDQWAFCYAVATDMVKDWPPRKLLTQVEEPHHKWPLRNVVLGVTVESQEYVSRIDLLRKTPAARRWVSFEPLLGPIEADLHGISWAVIGGEHAPNARPCHEEWIRSLVAQCRSAGVRVFVKQLGSQFVDRGGLVHHFYDGDVAARSSYSDLNIRERVNQ